MKTQLSRLALMGVLMAGLSACEDSDVLGLNQSAADSEVEFSVDLDLSDAMFEAADAEIGSLVAGVGNAPAAVGEPDPTKVDEARALIQQAREKMAEAREAWRNGDSELAAQLAEEARRLVAQALLLVFGEEAVERAMERIEHLISWLEEGVDEEASQFLDRIRELRDEAQVRWDAGDLEGALERLLLARQIAGRERMDHRRDQIAMHARLSIFMANSAIDLAVELIGEPTERQAHVLRYANRLTEEAERAFSQGRFRLAFELAREAVNLALVVVVRDTDLSPSETAARMLGIAEEAIAAAQAVVDPEANPFAARLLEHAENLKTRGAELIDTDDARKAVHILWHAAVLANGVVLLVS